jgi:hypothetical protein
MRISISLDPAPTVTITSPRGVVATLPATVVPDQDAALAVDVPALASFSIAGIIERVGGGK